jgi:hypothetical protein
MIIEMAASTILSLGAVSTRGASDTARFVAEEAERGRRQLRNSFSFGLEGKGVFHELYSVSDRCLVGDWDGYGAAPLSANVYALACQFLRALPFGIAAPSIGAEPDGHLTFEWYRSPRRLLSVSISPEGDLHYAALLGPNKAYGTEAFFGDVPRPILDLIHRVQAA